MSYIVKRGADNSEYLHFVTFQPSNVLTIEPPLQPSPEPAKRIVKFIHHALFQRNDSVVRDLDVLWANLRATFGDVAVTDPLRVSQFLDAIFRVERMHLQRRDVN